VAHLTHAEVDTCAVGCGAHHQILYGLRHPDLFHFFGAQLAVVVIIPISTMLLSISVSDSGRFHISFNHIIVIFHCNIVVPTNITSVGKRRIPVLY
jgi:hypothetical protein